jgi:hypothetical protein
MYQQFAPKLCQGFAPKMHQDFAPKMHHPLAGEVPVPALSFWGEIIAPRRNHGEQEKRHNGHS